jgi:hypothetical protein
MPRQDDASEETPPTSSSGINRPVLLLDACHCVLDVNWPFSQQWRFH